MSCVRRGNRSSRNSVVDRAGFEPALPEGGRFTISWFEPNSPTCPLERPEGVEPSSSAWKAVALPLSYGRPSPYHNTTRIQVC